MTGWYWLAGGLLLVGVLMGLLAICACIVSGRCDREDWE